MRRIASIFSVLLLVGGSLQAQHHDMKKGNEIAQQQSKVTVLVNTASWCPACQANGKRVEKDILSQYMHSEDYNIVVNDLSDESTKEASQRSCKEAGIAKVAANNNGTGTIYFVKTGTQKVISKVSVTKSTEEIKAAFKEALKKV